VTAVIIHGPSTGNTSDATRSLFTVTVSDLYRKHGYNNNANFRLDSDLLWTVRFLNLSLRSKNKNP